MMNVEMKKALFEIYNFCINRVNCKKCPLAIVNCTGKIYSCRLDGNPDEWFVEDLQEEYE